MTVTMEKPVLTDPVGGNSWRLRWSSSESDPLYRIYKDGRQIAETGRGSIVITGGTGEMATIEVRDDALPPSYAVRPRVDIVWDAVADTKEYRVEKFVGAAWTLVGVEKDRGTASYRFKSPVLSDTIHQFRVVPVGTDGNKGTPVAINFPLARHPDEPDTNQTYSSGTGLVTVAAN